MSFTLIRKGVPLFSRGPEPHWWLTGFKWGVFSAPEWLTMDVRITFTKKPEMHKEFVAALELQHRRSQLAGRAGYKNISIDADSVSFTFDKPTSFQRRSDYKGHVQRAQGANRRLVKRYAALGVSSNDPNQIPSDAANKLVEYFRPDSTRHSAEHLAQSLRVSGYGATEVGRVLQNVFSVTAQEGARILKDAGKTFQQVAEVLKSVWAGLLAEVLKSVFNQSAGQAAKVLGGIGLRKAAKKKTVKKAMKKTARKAAKKAVKKAAKKRASKARRKR